MKDRDAFLKKQIEAVEKTLKETDEITNKIINENKASSATIKKSKVNKTNKVIYLRDSEFRYNYFSYKDGFSEGGALYKDVWSKLRNYIAMNSLYLEDGNIKCDDFLKKYCKSETTSFFKLAAAFRRILL